MTLLEGRTAVVTGSAQGIGYAIAEAFAAEGANIVIADINADSAHDAAARLNIGPRAIGVAANVAQGADVDALVRAATTTFGSLDVWVNNAGITRDATMRKMSEDMFDEVIAVHLRGNWLGVRAASTVMREQQTGGSIINMSSVSGKIGNLGQTNYSSAKAGIVGLTKAAAKEVGFKGVRVNAVMPGLIRTPMTAAIPDHVMEERLKDIPLGRAGEPEDIAQAALFLASDMSSYITGTVIEVAGGRGM